MFIVAGYIHDDGSAVAYRVAVGVPPGPGTDGIVQGSTNARALLAAHAGQEVRLTPVGPSYVLDLNDPVSVLAALYALTEVVGKPEGDDVPDVMGPRTPGQVS
jgi:hypothetical protein